MKSKLLSSILTICFFGMLSAQNYPVTVVPQAVSPSPIYFSSYADAGTINSPLRVQLLLNDITLSNVEVRLKTYFEGNGIRFESNDAVAGANPIYLEGGVPVNLTNAHLAPFYSLQNISGINSNQYAEPIPEGSYQFCFEVYEAFTGNRLSARTCATTYIFKNEPPFLILPRRDETIDVINPQNIVFQWTPRHINVSNVEYELSIVEIWDNYVDPQAAFFSMPPIFQATTRNTSYLLGPADPLLLPNKKYAWRVQAKAISGTEEIGLFNNNGYSEIFWFTHSQPCEVPTNVRHEVKGTHQANIEWDDFSTEIPEYTVRYREKNSSPQGAWFYSRSNTDWVTIWDLRPGTTYEYQVNRKCQLIESEYSPVKTFTTFLADDESGLYNCGISPEINITNTDPLPDLFVNDVFKAGDFPIKVLEVSGSNGRFTGKGYVSMPYLKNIKVAVEFTNVLINTDKDLLEGMVITVYDPEWGGILNVDGVIDVVDAVENVFTGADNTILDPVDYDIDSIIVKDGRIVVTGTNGEQTTYDYDKGDTYQISGTNGVYAIDKNGKVTKIGETAEGGPATAENTDGISPSGNGTVESPSVSQVHTEEVTVIFRKGSERETETKYELDMVDNSFEQSTYPKAQRSDGTDYYPVHKAVVNNTTDVFYADITITNPEIKIDSLIFKTVTSGLEIKTDREGEKTFKITIEGKNAYRNEEAIITYKDETGKQQVVASFFIHHLHKLQTRKVQIVTVNGAPPIEGLEETLNDVFGVAGASFDVNNDIHEINIEPSVWDIDEKNEVLDYNGSGLLPDYPKEIRAIHQHYMANTANYDSKAYYLFLVDETIKVSKPINGFMPKGRQFGYIFNAYQNQGLGAKKSQDKVAAHELGHGVFSLEHPFESESNAGKTEWLMDYKKDGIQLPFSHWAVMSDTGLNLQLFQPDEEGELAGKWWFTPDWKPFKVDDTRIISTNNIDLVPQGTIPGVEYNSLLYDAEFDDEGKFKGYYNSSNKLPMEELEKLTSEKDSIFLFKNNGNCGLHEWYGTTYGYAITKKNSIEYSNKEKVKLKGTVSAYCPCKIGNEFIATYSSINDEKIQREVKKIASLICSDGNDPEFFKEFSEKGYDKLFAWQKTYYDEGYGDLSLAAFQKFFDAYNRYLQYYSKAKSVIKSSDDRQTLLKISYYLTKKQLEILPVEDKLKMLKVNASGVMGGYWTSLEYNNEALALKVINSVTDEQAFDFISGLTDENYSINKTYLYKILFNKIDDFFGESNFTQVAFKFNELTLKSLSINPSDINEKTIEQYAAENLTWDVENKDYWIIKIVKDRSKLEISHLDSGYVHLKQYCLEEDYEVNFFGNVEKTCNKWRVDNNKLSPFDLVSIYVINDITLTQGNGDHPFDFAVNGQVGLVPVTFLEFLDIKKRNAITENFIFNTLTVASIYFSGAEIIAAKGAMTLGVKLAIADLFVTFSDPYFSGPEFHEHSSLILKEVFDIEDEKAKEIATVLQFTWAVGATGATLSTAKDVVTPKKQIEALATYKAILNKVGDEKEVIRILANDKQLSRQVVDNFKIIENKLRSDPNVSKILDNEIEIATKKIDNIVNSAGNSIADIQNTLLDLLSTNSNLRKSISQLNVNADFNQTLIKKLEDLNVSNGKGGKLIDDFDQIVTEVSNPESLDKLLDVWHILQKGSPQIASIPENSKILAKVADRFAYRGEDTFAGLNKLFNEGSEVASKQKLINSLKEADQLFDEALKLPIQFSAIKKGEVTVNVVNTSDAIKITDRYGSGDEVARYIDGILQKKKVIPEGDGVKVVKQGNTPEDDILHKGDEVGFRAINGVNGTLEDLLQNPKFKEIYEGLINKTHIQFYKDYGLTEAEEAAYKLFIGDSYYSDFNRALAGTEGTKITPEYAALKKLMESAYSKLPKIINETVHRGAGATESIFAKTKKIGDEFDFEGRFTSSSIDVFTADNFRIIGKGNVIWQILSKTGVDLRAINKTEAEVLFKPFTKYKLMDIKPSEDNPDVLIYTIIEL